MNTYTLKRVSSNDDGTFGVLIDQKGNPVCLTLERPWRDNAPGVSCIPAETYLVQRTKTPIHGKTWQLVDVRGRTAILIHSGNTERDVEGCIMLGLEFGTLNAEDPDTKQVEAQPAVLQSREAVTRLLSVQGEDSFMLVVSW